MKKKKLIRKIVELESERDRLIQNEDVWEYMIFGFIKALDKHGVKAEIKLPESPMIETISEDGMTMKYIPGISTGSSTIEFDFSKHDEEILLQQRGITREIEKDATKQF